jgi:hypothetical protein
MILNLNKVRQLFSNENSVESLKKRSDGALSIFRATVVNLQSVNEDISKETSMRDEQIDKLLKENLILQNIQTDNGKFIAKINEFLN